MPREQAQVVAKGLTAMFVHNFDALVAKDYLDTHFREFDALEDRLEVWFERIDSGFSRLYLMFGITMAAVTIPVLKKLFG